MSDNYEEVFLNYRIGMKSQNTKIALIKVLGLEPEESGRLIGWNVGCPAGKPQLFGKIVALHGRIGVLKVKFRKGLPGQALGTRVKVMK